MQSGEYIDLFNIKGTVPVLGAKKDIPGINICCVVLLPYFCSYFRAKTAI